MKRLDWAKVDTALEQASILFLPAAEPKSRFVFPGAVLLVGRGGEIIYHKAFGCRSIVPDMSLLNKDMVFDVASLTKVMLTTLLAMQLVEEGRLQLDQRLSHIFQTVGTHGKEQMTIRHLLSHCSGFPATIPFYKDIARADRGERSGIMSSRGAVEFVYGDILRAKLENLPGRVSRYSDVGFILLGYAIETISASTLDKLALKKLIQPLKLENTGFIDLFSVRRRALSQVTEKIVPTARCPWRSKILCGEVHDDNAWAMGGIAAHAGIFSTAFDVHTFAYEMIKSYFGRGSLVSKETVRTFWKREAADASSTWALGWDTPSYECSSAGHFFSRSAVGHLGFTGCSLWIDPERELDVVLLSNRIHPSVENQAIKEFRPQIHDLVMQTLGYDQ